MRNSKCSRAKPPPQEAEEPQSTTLQFLSRMEALEQQSAKKDKIIHKLVSDMGNLKRSHYYIKKKQEEANAAILKSQAELLVETRKLHHDKFWFRLKQGAASKQN